MRFLARGRAGAVRPAPTPVPRLPQARAPRGRAVNTHDRRGTGDVEWGRGRRRVDARGRGVVCRAPRPPSPMRFSSARGAAPGTPQHDPSLSLFFLSSSSSFSFLSLSVRGTPAPRTPFVRCAIHQPSAHPPREAACLAFCLPPRLPCARSPEGARTPRPRPPARTDDLRPRRRAHSNPERTRRHAAPRTRTTTRTRARARARTLCSPARTDERRRRLRRLGPAGLPSAPAAPFESFEATVRRRADS